MARKCIDLTGQKFGRWTVIEKTEKPDSVKKSRDTFWLCKCECGNEKVVNGCNLRKGISASCGCLQKEKVKEHAKDLTGQKFGRLTVIKRAENKGKNICWLCKCECGNEKVIIGINLKNGTTISCGCLQKEKSSERIKQKWQDEDFRKMQSEKTKGQWKDEDFRKMQTERMKEQWKDEDFRKMKIEKTKEQWQDEDFRKMQSEKSSEKMKKKWQDEEMKWKMGYKGGITPIAKYLRSLQIVTQWRKDTYIRENSKCQLTGKSVHGGNSDVHHLKAFNTIVQEAHDLHNIQIKEIVADYTEEELRLLEDYIIKQHENTDNAVLLCDELHMLFHKPKKDGGYGKGNNTPEQFEEFKERYLAGEFKEILK